VDDLTKELSSILAGMNVPEKRRNLGDTVNLAWLLRKLAVGNPGHPSLARALELLRRISDYRTTRAAYESGQMPERRSGFDRRAPKSVP
jgi:hypothetical protein